MGSMWGDLRHAIRSLSRRPLLVLVAVLVLGCGIGTTSAVFTLVNAVFFHALPVQQPDRLRYVHSVGADGSQGPLSEEECRAISQRREIFLDVAGTATDTTLWRSGQAAEQLIGERVTLNYFDLLGAIPFLGRTFSATSASSGDVPVVVISDGLWQQRFNSDPKIIGRSLSIDLPFPPGYHGPARAYTIIGVMPRNFIGTASPWRPSEYWVPIQNRLEDERLVRQVVRFHGVSAIARLKPGVSDAQAALTIGNLSRQLRQAFHAKNPRWSLVIRGRRQIRLPFDPLGAIEPGRLAGGLLFVTGIVLLVAAANLAGMMVARLVDRRREIAVRLALGAGRLRVTREVLSESLLLAFAGGLVGLGMSTLVVKGILAAMPSSMGQFTIVRISPSAPTDWRVALFVTALCLVTGVLVGAIPAMDASRTNLVRGLAGASTIGVFSYRSKGRSILVICQIALSLALLAVAGSVVGKVLHLERIHCGYDPAHVVLSDFSLPAIPSNASALDVDADYSLRAAFHRKLLALGHSSPIVSAVSVAQGLPITPATSYVVARDKRSEGVPPKRISYAEVSAGHFEALGIRLLSGRSFETYGVTASSHVAVICESLAAMLWPGESAVGKQLAFLWPDSPATPVWLEVIGVVREVKPPLSEGERFPFVYTPLEQSRYPWGLQLVVRGRGPESEVIKEVRRIIAAAAPEALSSNTRSLQGAIDGLRYPRRAAAVILVASGLMALLVAAIGLYGIVSYWVGQRTCEMGVRAALGADRSTLVKLIVIDGLRLAAVGCVAGCALAALAVRLTSSIIVALPSPSLLTWAVLTCLLLSTIAVACYLPARRAARIDPMAALRQL